MMNEFVQSNNVLDCITFVFSFLVWPPALCTVFVLSFKSIKSKEFIAMLPLIASQLNSAFIWSCTACFEVGKFNYKINKHSLLNGDVTSFRDAGIKYFLVNTINL